MKRCNNLILLGILVSLLMSLWGGVQFLNPVSVCGGAEDTAFNTSPSDFVLSVAVTDLNRDGIDDVVASSADDTIYAINGLTGTSLWNNTAPSDDVWAVAVGDFNRDGVEDVLAGSWDSHIYIIDGLTGTIILSKATTPSSWIQSVAIADFNKDQIPDILVGSSDTNLYAISRDGTMLWNNTAPSNYVLSVAVGDLNRDGIKDVVAGSADSNVYAINGRTGSTLWINTDPAGWIHSVAVGGSTVVVGSSTGVYAFDNTGKTRWTSVAFAPDISAIALGDFNNDGIDDILASSSTTIFAINGRTGQPIWSNTDPLGVVEILAVGDFNNDGVDDGLAGSRDSNLYVIDGIIGETLQIVTDPTDVVSTLAIGDFNGDGIDDGLAGSYDSNLYIYWGQDRPPRIDHPLDIEYREGKKGNMITWHPSDNDPSSYTVSRNGTKFLEGTWDGSPITISIDNLNNGTYEVEISVSDLDGNVVSDIVVVTVIDSTPTIDQPSDQQYVEGQTGKQITWNSSDLEPSEYAITRNDTLIDEGAWDGSPITISIDGLDVGTYTYECTIRDDVGNSVSDVVIVTVLIDRAPRIDHPVDITYENESTGNVIRWNPMDEDPLRYTATLDDKVFKSGSWDGSEITVNVDGLLIGTHTIVLTVTDSTGNEANDEVVITVVPGVAESLYNLRIITLTTLIATLWARKKKKA